MNGYPNTFWDHLGFVSQVATFNKRMKLEKGAKPSKDCPSYSVVSVFFDAVTKALKKLHGHIKIELDVGDCNVELERILNGQHPTRAQGFPTRFTRMWMSNCP